ncbi:MAG TPA: FG-GAP-like repeat-containing protein, partial [Blastocatellia bacterium]|nr:FG-GAP-like repeat-containing protein [Blastocatellia bacterium]
AGQGAGRFSPLFSLPAESRPREFVIGDFNRDQLPDLAVTTSNPWQVVIYRGTTGGQFAVVDKLAAERFARVISANFNRDPLPDLAIINEFRVSAFLNGGNGFLPITLPGLPFNTSAGVAEDFNLDGITDLAFCSRERAGKIMLVSSEGTKQFVGSDRFFVVFPGISSSPSDVLTAGAGIGDFNRDGHLDMAVTNYIAFGQPGNITGNVSILLGNGAGGFQQVTNIGVGRAPHKVVVGDFNGDGKPDLAVTLLGENKVVVLTGDGTGFFGIGDSYSAGSVVIDLLAEDFNNDGKTDLAVGSRNNNTVTLMLGDGKGFFTLKSYPAGEAPSSLTAGDFNGDGKLDLAVAGGGLTKVTILPGDGAGAFGAGSSFTAGDRLGLLTAADFNGDNKLDLAVVSQPAGRETGIVTVFVNDGAGRFTAGKSHDLDGLINGISAPDLNRDGKPDLVLVNQLSIGATVLLNDGAGGFRAKTNYATITNPSSLALGDFNKDGLPDLVATTVTENVSIIYSACSPSPQLASVSAASYRAARLAADSVVAAFGSNLATVTVTANSLPLPTQLAGTRVSIKDSTGAERLATLFFVSPNQINYLMPPGTDEGQAVVTVQTNNTVSASAPAQIARVAPGLFTANAVGQGLAAALAIRLKADGSLVYEPIVRFNAASNQFVAVPIDLSNPSEQVFLSLFGTGLRARRSLAAVTASIGGIPAQVLYAGSQEGFAGLDQVNLSLSPGLSGRGEVDIVLTADGKTANVVKINIK